MKKAMPLLVLALAVFALAACGSSSGTTTNETESEAASGAAAGESEAGGEEGGEAAGGEGGGSTVEIEADPSGSLAYTQEEVTAKAGNVTINFNNPQPVGHDVDVETEGGEEVGKTEIITEGSESVTLKGLEPGKYTFFCSVPGHREAGMEGTLTVE
jgi:plastocyanin